MLPRNQKATMKERQRDTIFSKNATSQSLNICQKNKNNPGGNSGEGLLSIPHPTHSNHVATSLTTLTFDVEIAIYTEGHE